MGYFWQKFGKILATFVSSFLAALFLKSDRLETKLELRSSKSTLHNRFFFAENRKNICSNILIFITLLFWDPVNFTSSTASEASREVANLTERKNPPTPVYGVKEFVCLSVINSKL